jgi:hypothetical protein
MQGATVIVVAIAVANCQLPIANCQLLALAKSPAIIDNSHRAGGAVGNQAGRIGNLKG